MLNISLKNPSFTMPKQKIFTFGTQMFQLNITIVMIKCDSLRFLDSEKKFVDYNVNFSNISISAISIETIAPVTVDIVQKLGCHGNDLKSKCRYSAIYY